MADVIADPVDGSSRPPADATANAGVAGDNTLCFHTPKTAPADQTAAQNLRTLSRETLVALRERLVKTAEAHAGKGDTTNFRRWKNAKKAIREVDELIAATAAFDAKAQPK